MKFADPELLHLFWGIPILIVFYIFVFARKDKAMNKFGNPVLLRRMSPSASRPVFVINVNKPRVVRDVPRSEYVAKTRIFKVCRIRLFSG